MRPASLPQCISIGVSQSETFGIARHISGFRTPFPASCVLPSLPVPSRLPTIVQNSRSPGMQTFSFCFAPAYLTSCCSAPFPLRVGLLSSTRGLGLAPTERLALPWFRAPTTRHPFALRPGGPAPCAPCMGTWLLRTGIRNPCPHVTRT